MTPRTLLLGTLFPVAAAVTLTVLISGCAMPLATGPIIASEVAELRDAEYELIEVREHTDGLTYGLVASDGVIVEPRSPEEESWLLNPADNRIEIIERLNHSVPIARRSVVPFW